MVVAREDYAELIARAFDGAIQVDGARVVAHKSGMHVVRGVQHVAPERAQRMAAPHLDRDNDWSDV